jgi:uncharacterized membrane protein/mono/diheme cytochrome c family protein
MRRWVLAAVILAVTGSGTARAQPAGDARDFGGEVRGIFAKKCAGCHGPDVPKPKGRFGYILDLPRVAGNPEMVIPKQPDESELWALVRTGEMPPPDSPRGPLTDAEKETIRAWIAAGAPDVRPAPSGVPNAQPTAEHPQTERVIPEPPARLVRFLGKFHLLLLHFPIALLIAAGVGEVLMVRRGTPGPAPVVLFCLTLAALAVVPTVVLGWLHAAGGNGVSSPQTLSIHRWAGTGTGAWVIVAALWTWWDARRGVRTWSARLALGVAIVLVVGTAHAGGLLAHGRDFFDW